MPRKRVRSKISKGKRTKLALGVLALLFGLLVISWSIRFTQNFFGSKNYSWEGKFNINLLVRSSDISLLSYNSKDNKVTIINVPDETFLQVPNGFGSWQLRSIYGLGGDKLLKETLTNFFAIPIDGFIDLSVLKPPQSAAQLVDTLRKNPISGVNLLASIKTDLTMWELLQLKQGVSSVRFDKIRTLDLLKFNILDKENLADGTPVFTADPIKLDSILSDLQDPAIVSEHKSIAVFNATNHPQLAQKWARLITNLGGNVIITSNAKSTLQKTQVLGEQSSTLKRLQQIFDLDCSNSPKCGKISSTDEDIVSSRAQINLFLGEDYANR